MEFDARRCAEAAVRAAFAEAFTRPAPKRSRRGRRRRLRPLRAMFRLVRIWLMAVGLVTTIRVARDPELRHETIEALAARLPIEDLLEEIAVEVQAARAALADQAGAADEQTEAAEPKKATARRRRPASRPRGDTNGQRGRKPPNRGTRTA